LAALPAPSVDRVKDAAEALAAAMQARHGEQWIAIVDHDAGFALAARVGVARKGGAA
jgi:hypothetical protein